MTSSKNGCFYPSLFTPKIREFSIPTLRNLYPPWRYNIREVKAIELDWRYGRDGGLSESGAMC
jgi:hypothetical protein